MYFYDKNNKLRNHAANCETFCKNISHAKYFAKYSKIHFASQALLYYIQKQPSRGVLSKSYSENMQQTYRRTPMPKCAFDKVA